MSNICEHGHLARSCDVCFYRKRVAELEAECDKSSKILMRQYDKMTLAQVQELPWLAAAILIVAQDLGAVVANEGSKDGE